MLRLSVVACFVLFTTVSLSGCTGLEPAALGMAASTGQTAAGILGKGRVYGTYARELDDVVEAARQEINRLQLTMTADEQSGENRWSMRAVDNENDWVRLEFDARSPVLTRLEINVGWYGHEPTAGLIYRGIEVRLADPEDLTELGKATKAATQPEE